MANDEKNKLTDKRYGEIKQVLWFTKQGFGPNIVDYYVRANVDPSPYYPSQRIAFGQIQEGSVEFGGICLNVKQATDLVKMLKLAIADVTRACPSAVEIDVDDLDG